MRKITLDNVNAISHEYDIYRDTMKKYNVSAFDMLYSVGDKSISNRYTLTVIKNTYEKSGRKSFPQKPTITEIEKVGGEFYLNCITSIPFFKDRVTMNYTYLGYIPTRLVCTDPTNTIKIERIFKFELNN